jgi:hypothetical protein
MGFAYGPAAKLTNRVGGAFTMPAFHENLEEVIG